MNTIKIITSYLLDYYPSGLSFAEKVGPEIQPRKYNAKELDRTHGVNIYDYGWRMYDPAILQWWGVDPLAEKYYSVSPYAYCNNNPVNRVDPDGRLPFFLIPLAKGAVGAIVDAAAQVTVNMSSGLGFGEAMSNIDYTSVGASFITSAIVMPGMPTATKGATAAVIAIDAAVDVNGNGESWTVGGIIGNYKSLMNASIDAATSILPGKAVDGLTSSFNKAISADLGSKAAATMTKETKSVLKQAQVIINSNKVQGPTKAVTDYLGGLVGTQANQMVNTEIFEYKR